MALRAIALLLMRSKKAKRRDRAVDMLYYRTDDQSIHALIGALEDNDKQVRRRVIGRFEHHPDPRATDKLIQLLGDDEYRLDAILALGETRDSRAVPALMNIAKHPVAEFEGDVRHAVTALGKIGDCRALALLQELITKRYDQLPEGNKCELLAAIAKALENLGDIDTAKLYWESVVEDVCLGRRKNYSVDLKALGRIASASVLHYLLDRFEESCKRGKPNEDEFQAIEAILAREGTKAANSDLKRIAILHDEYWNIQDDPDAWFYSGSPLGTPLSKVDCRPAKNLAMQELLRRGIG
jgi:HEAT repeat protein